MGARSSSTGSYHNRQNHEVDSMYTSSSNASEAEDGQTYQHLEMPSKHDPLQQILLEEQNQFYGDLFPLHKGGTASSGLTGNHLDLPISVGDLRSRQSNHFEFHSSDKEDETTQKMIELQQIKASQNHSSQSLLNSSLISQQSQNLQSSSAIAGAMKALQNKVRFLMDQNQVLQEQNLLLANENQDIKQNLQKSLQNSQKQKEQLGSLLQKQKTMFQNQENLQKSKNSADSKALDDFRHRIDSSTKALEKLMKENVGLRSKNQLLESQLEQQNQEYGKKVNKIIQDSKDELMKVKKKMKKISKEKKDLLAAMKQYESQSAGQKQFNSSLIQDLEMKLKEMIHSNIQLQNDYNSYRQDKEKVLNQVNIELQELRKMLSHGQFQAQSKESENMQLKVQLQDFQLEIQTVKNHLQSLQRAHVNVEQAKNQAENFVDDVITVNELLVQQMQKRKCESQVRRSHNMSQISQNIHSNQQESVSGAEYQSEFQRHKDTSRVLSQRDCNTFEGYQKPPVNMKGLGSKTYSMASIPTQNEPQFGNKEVSEEAKRQEMEFELVNFQQKYDALLKDIATSKMPLQMRSATQGSFGQVQQIRY